MIVALLLLVPLIGVVLTTVAGYRVSEAARDRIYLAEIVAVFALALAALLLCLRGSAQSLEITGLCGMGLSFQMDGFRSVYTLIAAFMWLMTGLLSKQYFEHYQNRTRYYLFNQITLMATLGIFMSDNLYTTFIFFEIMSLSSYPWVAHDENEAAMHAARTYLVIAVFGGMVTLMGLFMAYARIGSLNFAAIEAARGDAGMTVPAALILVGFGAKAGLFPLYMWLPQAHPVAPAPASALLSGILTKTGVFGMLVISLKLMLGNAGFGNVLLALGLITMLLGAVLALLSSNLKRVLACSSMSQIGYITVGIAMAVLLGEEGSVPVSGAVMHMVNHSVLKLTLFMAAGVIYMNLHKLELNDIRGFGRGKPLLHLAFLFGGLGLAGVPLFNGYLGKTLIHEGILEYAEELGHFSIYNVCEWVFLFAAGITTAYMLKLYIALFWQKHPKEQKRFDALNGKYMNGRSTFALTGSMVLIPLLGMVPPILEAVTRLSAGFTGIDGVTGVAFFSLKNLQGGAVSLLIGTLVYLFVARKFLYSEKKGYISVSAQINWAENAPVKLFNAVVNGLCTAVDCALENPFFMKGVPEVAVAVFRFLSGLVDDIVTFLHETIFHSRKERRYRRHSAYYAFSYVAGHILDAFATLLNLTFYRNHPIDVDFTYVLAARTYDRDPEMGRVTRTVSFGLLMFAAGLLLTLLYLIVL